MFSDLRGVCVFEPFGTGSDSSIFNWCVLNVGLVIQDLLLACIMLASSLLRANDLDIEDILENDNDIKDQSAVLEYLDALKSSPFNINEVSARQLSTIPWISSILAVRLIHYRYIHGPFLLVEDIKKVQGYSRVYDKILPYLTVDKKRTSVTFHSKGQHRIRWQIEDSRGYQQHIYSGSKVKALNRLECSITKHFSFGCVCEKDAGERAWDDYRAGYALLDMPTVGSQLIVGTLCASFGQGLVFSGPYRLSKGNEPIAPVKQRSRGLYPYLSTAENSAFYGIGLATQVKDIEIHIFKGQNKMDARLAGDSVLSLPGSGYHRTANEIEAKNRLCERVHGLSIDIGRGEGNHIGWCWLHSDYDHFFPAADGMDQFDFAGDRNSVLGMNYDLSIGPLNVFGEIARSCSGWPNLPLE